MIKFEVEETNTEETRHELIHEDDGGSGDDDDDDDYDEVYTVAPTTT
jgi:hypothetical protein